MVDLFCRVGFIGKVYDLIKEMNVEFDFVVWGVFLVGCRMYKNLDLVEIFVRKLFELDSSNCGYYVLFLNMYVDVGRWVDVERIRIFMKNYGLIKLFGFSLIELKGSVYVFLVGDKEYF